LVSDERMTAGRWLEHWICVVLPNRVANGTLAPSTLAHHRNTVRLHLVPAFGHHRLTKLKAAHVDAFIATKRSATVRAGSGTRKYSGNSLRIMRSTLLKALRDARRAGYQVPLSVFSDTEAVSVRRRAARWLNRDEAKALMESVRGNRLEALYIFVLSLGLRRGEALGVAWADVDLNSKTIQLGRVLKRVQNDPRPDGTFPGGRTRLVLDEVAKTEESTTTMPIPDQLAALLKHHSLRQKRERLAAGSSWTDTGLVFTTPIGTALDPANVARSFSEACQKAGLGHRNLHQLRHSAASILLAQGIPLIEVSRFLRHTSLSVTADIYSHLDEETRRRSSTAMGEALWGLEPALPTGDSG
jgi:integrase